MMREFAGEGGRLSLTDDGILYGSGWNLSFPYGVEYSEARAKAAEPVKIAERVISAAAGYNYALYVTEDGLLHFVGDSGLPFRERFSFDGKIREVFAEPDIDVFRLIDERGEFYAWGVNISEQIFPQGHRIHAVVNDQAVTLRSGIMIWEYQKDGRECRCRGQFPGYLVLEGKALIKNRLSQTQLYRDLSREYGAENVILKYVLRSESEFRKIESPDWSDEECKKLHELPTRFPYGEGITNVRQGPYSGWEKDYVYSVGVYTFDLILYRPVKMPCDGAGRNSDAQNHEGPGETA